MFINLRKLIQPAIISSAIATVFLFGIQRLGVLEPIELTVFDQMLLLRTDLSADPRILVVGVSEKDLQKLQQWPLSGKILDSLFSKLEQYQPRVIGLDIFRDLRVEPGHDQLLKHLQQSDRIIAVCKHSDSVNEPTPPPAGIEPEQVGFSDIVKDTDDIVRRNLLLLKPKSASLCATPYSLGLQVVLHYLGNIQPKFSANGQMQIGSTIFKPLHSDSGGYGKVDANGFQILLNYRSAHQAVRQVNVTEVLENQIDPAWVKDKIILIGSTAPTIKDVFNTPYSASQEDNHKMAGVVLQAQMVSQILSAVVNKQPLFWFFPDWGEVLWIWVWSLAGGILAWRIQHPLRLILAGGVSLGLLFTANFIIFTHAGWIPVVSPSLGLIVAIGSVFGYDTFRNKQEQDKIVRQVQEQEETIALLQALLREGGNTVPPTTTAISLLQKGTLLNQRYKITEPLSSGGFGKTYLAEDNQRPSAPRCVVKHLHPARQDSQFLDIARRLFRTEAEILEVLGKNDRIPQLLAYFESDEQFYLVQELILGHSLTQEIHSGTRLAEAQVIDLLQDVLQVLVFVHSHHVIHRDIKPANLMRRQDNHLVLIDFGAVKQIQQQDEDNHSIAIGTAGYAPTEQILGQPRLNSDIYALGMVGIEALTGIPPKQFQRDPNGELVFKTDSNPNAVFWYQLGNFNQKLATILDKMVAYDFMQRYQSAQEVLQSLERIELARR